MIIIIIVIKRIRGKYHRLCIIDNNIFCLVLKIWEVLRMSYFIFYRSQVKRLKTASTWTSSSQYLCTRRSQFALRDLIISWAGHKSIKRFNFRWRHGFTKKVTTAQNIRRDSSYFDSVFTTICLYQFAEYNHYC